MIMISIVCCLLFLYLVIGSLMMLYMVPILKKAGYTERVMREVVLLGTIKWAFRLREFSAVVRAKKELEAK